ncbi:accessory factor UbiK family protein [Thiomonas sp.]
MTTSTPNSPKAFLRRAAEALDKSPLKDMQRNARALAQSAAGRLDLVTRDEFDALQAMLAASSQRIAQLEAQVAALENPQQSASGLPPSEDGKTSGDRAFSPEAPLATPSDKPAAP